MEPKMGSRGIVGFTCGSFDLLHAGHVMMLEFCKRNCDYLIVGLQVDPSVDRGDKNKPVQSVMERWLLLRADRHVDEVVIYRTEEELYELLQILRDLVDVRFVGRDWAGKEFTGKDLQIPIVYTPRKHKFSSHALRVKVYDMHEGLIVPEEPPETK